MAFDGVDALPRNSYCVSELLLRPASVFAKLFDPVLDVDCHVKLTFHGIVLSRFARVKVAVFPGRTVARPRAENSSLAESGVEAKLDDCLHVRPVARR